MVGKLFDLHSTMLLLYPCVWEMEEIRVEKFTFHYASTLSLSVADAIALERKFTFHYASTLSSMLQQNRQKILIYIPLCFYFIVMRSVRAMI